MNNFPKEQLKQSNLLIIYRMLLVSNFIGRWRRFSKSWGTSCKLVQISNIIDKFLLVILEILVSSMQQYQISLLYQIYQIFMSEQKIVVKTEKRIERASSHSYPSRNNNKLHDQLGFFHTPTLPLPNCHLSAVSLSPENLRHTVLTMLENSDDSASATLHRLLTDWLSSHWKEIRMMMSARLNKLKYLQPSLLGETFQVIEKELMLEWRKNNFLQGLQLLWTHVFRSHAFAAISELEKFYKKIRQIIAQVSYMLFQPCFKNQAKDHQHLQSRLMGFTAVNIITTHKGWKQIAENVIKAKYCKQMVLFSQNFDLSELNPNPYILDLQAKKEMFKETASALERLITSYNIDEIVLNLKKFRSSLVEQIQQNINNWVKQHCQSKHITVEKEDILASIIYTMVHHKLDHIGAALSYISFAIGQQIDFILGFYKVDLYRVDLEVAYEYLTRPLVTFCLENIPNEFITT